MCTSSSDLSFHVLLATTSTTTGSFRSYCYWLVFDAILFSIAPSCTSPSTAGLILNLATSAAPSTYTPYNHSFTATDSSATLSFVPTGDHGGGGNHYWLLDQVSVNHTNTSTEVIINGGFETGDFTGWTQFCNTTSNCGGVYYSYLVTTPCRSGNYCVYDSCQHYDYLLQTFPTVIGDYYLVSYYLRIGNTGGGQNIYVLLT
jgi:hypothetical protein